MPHNTIVGVLRGGPSSEYDVSLKTGATVLRNLPEPYVPADIFISKDGDWHVAGIARAPERALKGIDVVFNALHGEYGEDGKVQQILEGFAVPYTGSGVLSSALAMNKILAKKTFVNNGIKTPYHMTVRREQMNPSLAREIFMSFPQPSVIKPASGGSSIGVTVAYTIDDLIESLNNAFLYSDSVLIEEYISGREATCGVIDNFREQKIYSLMPTEILDKTNSDIWGYDSKYSQDLHEIRTPGNFSSDEKSQIQAIAKLTHDVLGLRHYSRADFIIHPKRGVYLLEVNTLPGLTETSLFPHALEASGSNLPEFFDHAIQLALNKI